MFHGEAQSCLVKGLKCDENVNCENVKKRNLATEVTILDSIAFEVQEGSRSRIGSRALEQSSSLNLPDEIITIFELREILEKSESDNGSSDDICSDKYSHFCGGLSDEPALDDRSIIQFIEHVTRAPELAESLKFELETRPGIKQLAKNAFILRLICWSWNRSQYLPESKRELFDRFFQALFIESPVDGINLEEYLSHIGRLSLPTLMMNTVLLPMEFYMMFMDLGILAVLKNYSNFSSSQMPFSSDFIDFDHSKSAIKLLTHKCMLEFYTAKYLESLLENTKKEIHTATYTQEQVAIFSNIFTYINNKDILEKSIQFGHWTCFGLPDFSLNNPFCIKIKTLQGLRNSARSNTNPPLATEFDPAEITLRNCKNPFKEVLLRDSDLLKKGMRGNILRRCSVGEKMLVIKQILTFRRFSMSELVALNRVQNLPKHPNIVTIFRTFQLPDGCFNIFMEGVGRSLEQFLKQKGPQSEDTVRHVVKDVASGLQFLHEHEIAHFDLKTSHVLVLVDNAGCMVHFKISGFSPRKDEASDRTDIAFSIMGDYHFMAPEVFVSPPSGFGPKSDCWSLGCIILHTITGNVPFLDANDKYDVGMTFACNQFAPEYISYMGDTTKSELLSRILEHLFVFDPDERYNASQVLELLDSEEVLSLEPTVVSGGKGMAKDDSNSDVNGSKDNPPSTDFDDTHDVATDVLDIEMERQNDYVLIETPFASETVKPWNRFLFKLISFIPFFSPRSFEYPETFVLAGNPAQMRRYGLVRQEHVEIVQYSPDQLPTNGLPSTNQESTTFLLQPLPTRNEESSNGDTNGDVTAAEGNGCVTGMCADLDSLVRKNSGSSFLVDTALFTANFSRMLSVLKAGHKHDHFVFMIVLLSLSMGLQAAIAIILIWNDRRNVNHSNQPVQNQVSRCVTLLMTISLLLNLVNIMSAVIDGEYSGTKDGDGIVTEITETSKI